MRAIFVVIDDQNTRYPRNRRTLKLTKIISLSPIVIVEIAIYLTKPWVGPSIRIFIQIIMVSKTNLPTL